MGQGYRPLLIKAPDYFESFQMNPTAVANKRIEFNISNRIPDDEIWKAIEGDDRLEALVQLAEWGNISSRKLNDPNPLRVRIGDVVKIKLAGSKTFVASVLEVTERFEFSKITTHNGMLRTKDLIRFRPHVSEADAPILEECFVTAGDDNTCDVGYVVEVVHRTLHPFPSDRHIARNRCFLEGLYSENGDCPGSICFVHPMRLARSIVRNQPSLDLPYGLSVKRLLQQWAKSGYPGLGAEYRGRAENGRPQGIRKKAFRKWLLRALPKVAKTKAEALSAAYRLAIEEERDSSYF